MKLLLWFRPTSRSLPSLWRRRLAAVALSFASVLACSPEDHAQGELPASDVGAANTRATAPELSGERVYTFLRDRDALSTYMVGRVEAISIDLLGPSVRVNLPYRRQATHVYVVRDSLLSAPTPMLGDMQSGDFAKALPDLGIAILNERHLKEIVTLAVLDWHEDRGMARSLAYLTAARVEALASIWDPSLNRLLRSDEITAWSLAVTGALAFVLAHEFAHIELGHADPMRSPTRDARRSLPVADRTDRRVRWACPDLIEPRFNEARAQELEADAKATQLLVSRNRTRYEVGAEWYTLFLLVRSLLEATASGGLDRSPPSIAGRLEEMFGSESLKKIRARRGSSVTDGPISHVYTRTHPSTLRRLSLSNLFQTDPGMMMLLSAFDDRMRRECQAIERRRQMQGAEPQ